MVTVEPRGRLKRRSCHCGRSQTRSRAGTAGRHAAPDTDGIPASPEPITALVREFKNRVRPIRLRSSFFLIKPLVLEKPLTRLNSSRHTVRLSTSVELTLQETAVQKLTLTYSAEVELSLLSSVTEDNELSGSKLEVNHRFMHGITYWW